MTQIIVFKLQFKTGGNHNIDLSRAVVKFEDLLANMIFHGYINDMHANLHFHLKLFYSPGYRARGRKPNRNLINHDDDDNAEGNVDLGFGHDHGQIGLNSQPTVFDALVATFSTEGVQRDGAQAFLKQLEQTDPTYRETLARELVDESKPVCLPLSSVNHVSEIQNDSTCFFLSGSSSSSGRHTAQEHPLRQGHQPIREAN
jgi:hypothetical protein